MPKTKKSLHQQIEDLVAVVQRSQRLPCAPHGPAFCLDVRCETPNQYTVKLHICAVKEEYRSSKDSRSLEFTCRAISSSAAMEGIREILAEHIETKDYINRRSG